MHHERWLPRYLAIAYAVLTAYACLHPFSGWRDTGLSPFAFFVAPWPQYVTLADLWLNSLGFIPLGFMIAASFRYNTRKRTIFIVTTLLCALLSASLEFAQNYLPTRFSSNVDLATNTLGGMVGAFFGQRLADLFVYDGFLHRWRRHHILHGHIGEVGLILMALWWLTQLEPTSTLFGTGDVRPLFDLPAAITFSARRFVVIEAMIVSMNVMALGLLVQRCMRVPNGTLVAIVLLGGLAVRSIADYLFIIPPDPWHWATPGAIRGLVIGLVALVLAWRMPGWLQHSLTCVALLLSTVLVNIAPENPFELASMRLVHEGHFLNFHGLTRLTDSLWPFLALIYLSANAALGQRR